MKIPKFWAQASAETTPPRGRPVRFSCWRSSDTSEAVAHQSALAAARRIMDAFLRGKRLDRYEYGCVPLREEVLNQVKASDGRLLAVVTRNGYGSVVLNAERVMFVDIDFPDGAGGGKSLFKGLFGRKQKSPEEEKETRARVAVDQFIAANPSWGMRLYRTFAGLRAIVTHDVMDPQSTAALDVLKQLGSDPLYIKLCKAQECFRARLTAKPWRCGCIPNPLRHPITDQKLLHWYEQWKEDYETRQAQFATCRLLDALGNPLVHPDAALIVELHDFTTRCNVAMPLA
ncbi:MAG: hypothetical protein ABSG53_14585 [Thermoguttaceae bacterium]|jgi:hypothetical protein